jgi:hypothetical protein
VKTAEIIISTTVDYKGQTLQAIEDALKQHQQAFGSTIHKQLCGVRYTSRFYQSSRTHGLSLSSIGDRLREAGFSPDTHRIIFWHTNLDCVVFSRAIRGHSQLFDYTTTNKLMCMRDTNEISCLQPYNLAHLLKDCSSVLSAKCGFMYRSWFDEELTMHMPDADIPAMCRLYQLFLSVWRSWLESA